MGHLKKNSALGGIQPCSAWRVGIRPVRAFQSVAWQSLYVTKMQYQRKIVHETVLDPAQSSHVNGSGPLVRCQTMWSTPTTLCGTPTTLCGTPTRVPLHFEAPSCHHHCQGLGSRV